MEYWGGGHKVLCCDFLFYNFILRLNFPKFLPWNFLNQHIQFYRDKDTMALERRMELFSNLFIAKL